MVFDNWAQIIHILITASITYVGLITMLRLSGKRTLTQMNAFDFIVTVALGSTFATSILSKNTPLAEGLVGIGTLILLQLIVSWICMRFPGFNKIIKSEPRILFYRGEFKSKALCEERITIEELLQAARSQGILSLTQIEAIILETNGKFSIVKKASQTSDSTLQNVNND